MTHTVHCQLLDKDLPGLEYQTYPGELGKRIFENISAEAWQQWLRHQTMLINENRLSPINPEHRRYLEDQMEKFFFSGGADQPVAYTPVDD
jgi:Fe-S cluster biosynthesis and repair protein YggX